jgi:hypothetical protein
MPTMNVKEFLLRKKKRKRDNLVVDNSSPGDDNQQHIENHEKPSHEHETGVKDDDNEEACLNSAPIDLLSNHFSDLESIRSPQSEKQTLSRNHFPEESLVHPKENRLVSEVSRLEEIIEKKEGIINYLRQELEDTRALERKAHDELLKARRQTLEYKERVFQIQLKFQRWDKLLQEWMERNRGKPKQQWDVRPAWDDNTSTPKPDHESNQILSSPSSSTTIKRKLQCIDRNQSRCMTRQSSPGRQVDLDSVRSQLEKKISDNTTTDLKSNLSPTLNVENDGVSILNHSRNLPDEITGSEEMTQLSMLPDMLQTKLKDGDLPATSTMMPTFQIEKNNRVTDPSDSLIDNDLTQLDVECEKSATTGNHSNQDVLMKPVNSDSSIHNSVVNDSRSSINISSSGKNIADLEEYSLFPSDLKEKHETKACIESVNTSESKPDSSDDEGLIRDAKKLAVINNSTFVELHSSNQHPVVKSNVYTSKKSEAQVELRRVTLSPFTKPQQSERSTQYTCMTEGSETQWSSFHSKTQQQAANEPQSSKPSIESLEDKRSDTKILNQEADSINQKATKQTIPVKHVQIIDLRESTLLTAPDHSNKYTDKDSNVNSTTGALNGWKSNLAARAFLDESLDHFKGPKEPKASNVMNPYKRVKGSSVLTSAAINTGEPESTISETSTHFKSANPLNNESQVDYKYVQVVRGKKKRECLPGHSCQCCDPFWAAVCDDNDVFDRKQFQDMSRHRGAHSPENTPPNFWDLSFRDEVLARKRQSDISDKKGDKK